VLICDDSEADPRVDREACRSVGARSMIVVPLVDDNQTVGVLKVYSAEAYAFTDTHVRLLALLASMIASALARADLLARLGEQALRDELTGLPNRRAWYGHLEHAVARARRTRRPLSVLVLDVDGLKEANDRHGHDAGDRLLKSMSARWSTALRASDLLGRLGGDEFGVILDETGEAHARAAAERLERALEAGQHASIGLAVWNHEEDASALVSRADTEMYVQKQAHKSRAVGLKRVASGL
jgi:diguanylate cyclase (GGDEF)-like protein